MLREIAHKRKGVAFFCSLFNTLLVKELRKTKIKGKGKGKKGCIVLKLIYLIEVYVEAVVRFIQPKKNILFFLIFDFCLICNINKVMFFHAFKMT